MERRPRKLTGVWVIVFGSVALMVYMVLDMSGALTTKPPVTTTATAPHAAKKS